MSETRTLPACVPRCETGPTRFGNDWPGLFIRGDNAAWLAMNLQLILEENISNTLAKMALYSLLEDLRSTRI